MYLYYTFKLISSHKWTDYILENYKLIGLLKARSLGLLQDSC